MTAMYFEEKQEIAYGAVNLWCELAVFVGFILTPILPVEIRLYVMMGALLMGCIGYFAVDFRQKEATNQSARRADEMMFELSPREFPNAAAIPTRVAPKM